MITIFNKSDLNRNSHKKDIEDITLKDIAGSMEIFKKSDVVVVFYDRYNYKVLKNRFGNGLNNDDLPEEVINEIRYRRLNWVLSSP